MQRRGLISKVSYFSPFFLVGCQISQAQIGGQIVWVSRVGARTGFHSFLCLVLFALALAQQHPRSRKPRINFHGMFQAFLRLRQIVFPYRLACLDEILARLVRGIHPVHAYR